jgi:hypothetical protein
VANDAKFTNEYFCAGTDTHTYFGIRDGVYWFDTLSGWSDGSYTYDYHEVTS